MKCDYCGIDIEQVGNRPKRFCSDRCRMRSKRTVESEQVLSEQVNPNTPVVLSDGQEFYPDLEPQRVLDCWFRGTGYQHVLARTSLMYDLMGYGSEHARLHAIEMFGTDKPFAVK